MPRRDQYNPNQYLESMYRKVEDITRGALRLDKPHTDSAFQGKPLGCVALQISRRNQALLIEPRLSRDNPDFLELGQLANCPPLTPDMNIDTIPMVQPHFTYSMSIDNRTFTFTDSPLWELNSALFATAATFVLEIHPFFTHYRIGPDGKYTFPSNLPPNLKHKFSIKHLPVTPINGNEGEAWLTEQAESMRIRQDEALDSYSATRDRQKTNTEIAQYRSAEVAALRALRRLK